MGTTIMERISTTVSGCTRLMGLVLAVLGLNQIYCADGQDRIFNTGMMPLAEKVEQSTVIAYANMETNKAGAATMIVAEIWKGATDARSLGITNGLRIPFEGDRTHISKRAMDAAVLLFQRASGGPQRFKLFSIHAVYAGRIGGIAPEKNLSTNEFRAKLESGFKADR
jgi:hypothetical protein